MLFVLLKWQKGFLQVSYFLHCAVSSCQVQYPSSLWAQKPYQVENRFVGFLQSKCMFFLQAQRIVQLWELQTASLGLFLISDVFFLRSEKLFVRTPHAIRALSLCACMCVFFITGWFCVVQIGRDFPFWSVGVLWRRGWMLHNWFEIKNKGILLSFFLFCACASGLPASCV